MADPKITVAPPERHARVGGLFPVVDIREGAKELAASTGLQFVNDPCEMQFNDAGFCYSDIAGDTPKVFAGVTNAESIVGNFALYYGVQCWMATETDFAARARTALEFSEGRFVENKLITWIDAAVDGAAQASLAAAIGEAEERADNEYIGRPVLHMNRADVVLAVADAALIVRDDFSIWTPNGSPVVSSGQYAGGVVRATGAVTVLRSGIVATTGRDPGVNEELALAERVYGLIVDCNYRINIPVTP